VSANLIAPHRGDTCYRSRGLRPGLTNGRYDGASICLLICALGTGCASNAHFDGPMPVRNQHPAQLNVLHMNPENGSALAGGEIRTRVDAAYSSLFLSGSSGDSSFSMDGEILRAGWKTRVGLGHGLDLQFELPVAYTTGGFLDSFISSWHEFFGLPDHGRRNGPQNQFDVTAVNNGAVAYQLSEDTLGLLDIPVAINWAAIPTGPDQPFGLALRAGIEFPTGDSDRGFGNGAIDYALGMVGEWRHGALSLSAQLQHTFAGTPDRASQAGLEFGDVSSAGLTAEVLLSDTWTALVQTEVESSTLRGLGFARTSDPQWLLWVGARARVSETVGLEFAIGEDVSAFVAPDITAYAALTFHLGRPERGS